MADLMVASPGLGDVSPGKVLGYQMPNGQQSRGGEQVGAPCCGVPL